MPEWHTEGRAASSTIVEVLENNGGDDDCRYRVLPKNKTRSKIGTFIFHDGCSLEEQQTFFSFPSVNLSSLLSRVCVCTGFLFFILPVCGFSCPYSCFFCSACVDVLLLCCIL